MHADMGSRFDAYLQRGSERSVGKTLTTPMARRDAVLRAMKGQIVRVCSRLAKGEGKPVLVCFAVKRQALDRGEFLDRP